MINTVLVTGVAGFIGSHVAEKLIKGGHRVIGIDNFDPFYNRSIKEANLEVLRSKEGFSFFEIDLTDLDQLLCLPTEIDSVIHLAAKAGVLPSLKDPNAYIATNIGGTQTLNQYIQQRGIKKYVFASSSSIYGNNIKTPFSEYDSVDRPISIYAFTKKACELMNYTLHHLQQVDIINLRLFSVYGPRQRPDLAIRKFIQLVEEGKPVSLYGDGNTARDYTYVEDIAEGIVLALDYVIRQQGVYEIINLGNNQPVQLKDLVATISQVLDKPVQINYLPMQPGDVELTYADISKAQSLLSYQPRTSLEQGIRQFVESLSVTNIVVK